MTKPVLCSLAPYAIKSIHRHADILVIKETNGFAAVVLESDASAKDLLDQVLTGPRREIALESPVLGFLWDDVITGAASVAGLKRLPQHIKAKIEQFGVINHHISPLIYTVGANVEEIGQALGWHLRPNP